MNMMVRTAGLLALCFVLNARATDATSGEAMKIEYLIASVASLADARFIRNGTAYDAKAAADHLRLKLKMAGSRVQSAEDFITYCASVSSVSGAPYLIRFADGREMTTASFLRSKLKSYEIQKGNGAGGTDTVGGRSVPAAR
jgi:hypothetical protein